MWDSPSWLSTAIRSKIDERIASENRASNEAIASANRQSNERIAEANRLSAETIAAENREMNKIISDLDRASQEAIAEARNNVTQYGIDVGASTAAAQRLLEKDLTNIRVASNERIAANELSSREGIALADRQSREKVNRENIIANLYNEKMRRELTASEGAKTRELTASEGEKNRQTQLDVAKMNVAQRIVSDGVRLVPYLFSSDFKFNGGGFGGKTNSVSTTVNANSVKSKADALFPELEPTFKISAPAITGALMVSALSGMASFVPFI